MEIYKFRDCLLNTGERSVLKDGSPVCLTTKTFDVLLFLIENRGRIVTKDEILGTVWDGNIVEESNLPVHISKLRKVLNDTKSERYVETVHGSGYRFVSPIESVGEDEWIERRRRRAIQSRIKTVGENSPLNSIAVLPLRNESGEQSTEYLANGLTEGLINGLSTIPGLKVIARDTVFQYKREGLNVKEIGEALGVSRIVTGRVRLANDVLIVGAELINVFDGSQAWGRQYSRPFSEIVKMEQEILNALTAASFQSDSTILPPTENAESYKYYLMGRYLVAKRTTPEVHKAIGLFHKSVASCPTNVYSYAAIVDGYHLLHAFDEISRTETLDRIRPVLETLSHLNQSVDVVQLMHGRLKLYLEWKLGAAERHVRQALALNANFVAAHSLYAEIMLLCGKQSEAVKHANQLLALDPMSQFSLKQVGRIFYKVGQYDTAISYLNDALEMEQSDFETLLLIGASLAEQGKYKESLRFLKMSYSHHRYIETLSMIGYVNALAGRRDEATNTINQIKLEFADDRGHPLNLARVYLALGEIDETYHLLDEAYRQRSVDLYGLGLDPRWSPIKSDQRFKSLIRRVREANNES